MLETIARNKIPTLSFFDELKVYLGYPIKLKQQLDIPIDAQGMLYFSCSVLKPKDLQEAKDFVLSKQENKKSILSFLLKMTNGKKLFLLIIVKNIELYQMKEKKLLK